MAVGYSSQAAKLAETFAPRYSYAMPAWWQTKQGGIIIIAAGIGLLALIALAVWYRFFYRPPLTLAQWRQRELRALQEMRSREVVNYKIFFGAVTFFLKQYLLRLYGWQILDKTDDELLGFLNQQKEIPASLRPRIEELLSYAQMVKFADQAALAERADEALTLLKLIVKSLKASKKQ